MLDIVPSSDSRPRSMMSLDLSPYLLSASPPVSEFSLHSLSLATNYNPYSFFSPPPSRPPASCAKVYGTSCASDPPKSIMSITPSDDSVSCTESPSLLSQTSSGQSFKSKKRVSFADDSGFPLAEVRLMLDNPAAPPVLSIRGVSGLSASDQDALLNKADEEGSCSSLIPPDPQPWLKSNFQEDLRRNMVGVENVYVKDHELICSIFVDTRPASKRVFGRCSLDSWQTFQDVTAVQSQMRRPGYDSYQFTLHVPSTMDRSKPIQFAVCFEADGVQHWDNNEGKNYVIHWRQEENGVSSSSTYLEDSSDSSTDFEGLVWCSHRDIDRPFK